ncbi:MAG: hypothetical protein HUU11_02165 [Anaerolineales bacterium]|nr:hypothetical protein [Anaerolineales bacterium]NUQ83494.1 hypothetical protein [Anaerolineales bacterium]
MKIIKNEKLIKRNGRIGQWTSLGALAVLGLGMYISFTRTDLFVYSIAALLVGFTLTQIGMYMGNRYGRSPRLDEKLDAGLKGLQNEFVIYHYMTPASHLLVGPAGIWILMPYHQRGQVLYRKNRWRLSGGGFLQAYMRIFGQENLGRPDLEIDGEIKAVKKYLAKQMDESEIPEIRALMVFTNENVEIEADDAPVPALKLKEIKEFFRKKAKEKPIGPMQLAAVKAALSE